MSERLYIGPGDWPHPSLREIAPHAYAELYMDAFMCRPAPESDRFLQLGKEDQDAVIESWRDPSRPLSRHMQLAVSAAFRRRQLGGEPLKVGEPIPGCNCPECTGLPADHPVRVVPLRTRYRRTAYRQPLDVERARAVPILDVARRLKLEIDPRLKVWARCPFHEDKNPSLHLNPKKNRAFCNPCGRSWDSIALYRDVGGLTFPDAVRELAA